VQRVADPDDEPRFAMLETIREFGLEQLAASGEEIAVRDAHAAWCITLAERAEPELAGPEQERWVRRLEADLGNIRAAHDWLAAQGNAEASLRLVGAIGWFWSSAPYFEEARARLDQILAMPGAERAPAALAKALATAGDVADWQGDQPRARVFFERALAIYRDLDDRARMASMLRGLGSSAIDRGELELAVTLLAESLTLAEEVGAAWEVAAATNLLGTAAMIRGDLSGAMEQHMAAAAAWRELGDSGHVMTALTSYGWAALISHEWSSAAAAYGEALALAVAQDDAWYRAWCIIGAGGLAAGMGNVQLAAELLAAGAAERERLGVPLRPGTQAALDEIVNGVRRRLGAAKFAAAWQTGRALPIASAVTPAATLFATETLPEPAPFGLTRRERDVLRLLAVGQSDKEIADALFVSARTASGHVSAILSKLGVESRAAAVAIAFRQDLV
jgi:non-specific serine/threonine protein kinase